jgi:hypothetical protein
MTPEGTVKKGVKNVLNKYNVWYFMPVQNGMGVVGVPDIIACLPMTVTQAMVGKRVGLFVGIETKAPGKENTLTPNQKRQLNGIRNSGGFALVLTDPTQLLDVLEATPDADPTQ